MVEPISAIANAIKTFAENSKLIEAFEFLETKEVEIIKESPILNTIDEINNSSLETLKLKNEVTDIERIKTINSQYEGKVHPASEVPYEKDVIELPDGRKIEGVFPVFESLVDIQLPENLLQETSAKQMRHCNLKLSEMIENNPELKSKFTEQQIEQLKSGLNPSDLTWHHHQQTGKMQLVDTSSHVGARHTGGNSIWGSGK